MVSCLTPGQFINKRTFFLIRHHFSIICYRRSSTFSKTLPEILPNRSATFCLKSDIPTFQDIRRVEYARLRPMTFPNSHQSLNVSFPLIISFHRLSFSQGQHQKTGPGFFHLWIEAIESLRFIRFMPGQQ